MSYWVEVQCDVRSGVPDPSKTNTGRSDIACHSIYNANPAAAAATARTAATFAGKDAKAHGWTKRYFPWGEGWVCPHCQKFPPAPKP